jgi:hypothetical protein
LEYSIPGENPSCKSKGEEMKKTIVILAVIATLLLAACGQVS